MDDCFIYIWISDINSYCSIYNILNILNICNILILNTYDL